jgi:hypothetical protein
MNKELLCSLIMLSDIINLNLPTTGEFPHHIWEEGVLDDFVYNPETKTLELYRNPGYEL